MDEDLLERDQNVRADAEIYFVTWSKSSSGQLFRISSKRYPMERKMNTPTPSRCRSYFEYIAIWAIPATNFIAGY